MVRRTSSGNTKAAAFLFFPTGVPLMNLSWTDVLFLLYFTSGACLSNIRRLTCIAAKALSG